MKRDIFFRATRFIFNYLDTKAFDQIPQDLLEKLGQVDYCKYFMSENQDEGFGLFPSRIFSCIASLRVIPEVNFARILHGQFSSFDHEAFLRVRGFT